MEIERKWMVDGWPAEKLPLLKEEQMDQGYVSVHPTVRIRKEAEINGPVQYVLCLKSSGLLARKEIEISIEKKEYEEIVDLIGLPMIQKRRRTYGLPDGNHLEVNHVDVGLETEFWYAEVEYESVEAARKWDPAEAGLGKYLRNDVTDQPGQSMGEYWLQTRVNRGKEQSMTPVSLQRIK
jgi:adenylate cyclase